VIIFDLDGTLADCEHRRYFVDPSKNPDCIKTSDFPDVMGYKTYHWECKKSKKEFKPEWKSFYEACDQDKPILPVIKILNNLARRNEIEIWSGRCESVREKTEHWIEFNCFPFTVKNSKLRMRPMGDNTPDDLLKDTWIDILNVEFPETKIDFVFDDRPKVRRMWQRRGIFVFNCCQHDQEF